MVKPKELHKLLADVQRTRGVAYAVHTEKALRDALVGAKITRFEVETFKVPYASGSILIIETDAEPVKILGPEGQTETYDLSKLRWLVSPLHWKKEEGST